MDLNLRGGGDQAAALMRRAFSSSPNSLSSPPASSISNTDPTSPSHLNRGRANIDMDEIVVDTAGGPRFGVMAPPQPPPSDVPLTAAGVPRKKPGRKPGTTVKPKEPKVNPDGSIVVDPPKAKRVRKPKDPNAPPVQRKRKAVTQDVDAGQPTTSTSAAAAAVKAEPPKSADLTSSTMPMDIDSNPPTTAASRSSATPAHQDSNNSTSNPPAKVPKREGIMSLLNDDPPPSAPAAVPTRMAFDPVRSTSSYDPVRGTMVTRDPYGTAGLSSPRAPSSQMPNRASASPSISSLVDPPAARTVVSPTPGNASIHNSTSSRLQESGSQPASPSPSQQLRKEMPAPPPVASSKTSTSETKRTGPTLMPQPPASTKTAAESTKVHASSTSSMAPPSAMPAPASKKIAAVQAQTRKEKKASSNSSSPKLGSLKNAQPDVPALHSTSNDRSILDFGKAAPGEEQETPSIVLEIELNGEGNKYVNFMRLAEEQYGWDALHPRQAADRERKARIAAASAALEKQQGGRDSAAEEEEPDNSGSEEGDSNVEMGGMGNGNNGGLTSGADAAAAQKPPRKKRNWREDEYDKGDDFVDDSEMLWEEQAAAVQDGFFVYSGPLVPEVPKPPAKYVLQFSVLFCSERQFLVQRRLTIFFSLSQ